MDASVSIRPATREDAIELGGLLRADDAREVYAQSALSPLDGCLMSFRVSSRAYTARWQGELACMFGVAPMGSILADEAAPWLLGTDLIVKRQRTFLRYCVPRLQELFAGYARLENYVDVRNAVSIKWLGWLGFTIEQDPVPHGPFGRPFRRFYMGAKDVYGGYRDYGDGRGDGGLRDGADAGGRRASGRG